MKKNIPKPIKRGKNVHYRRYESACDSQIIRGFYGFADKQFYKLKKLMLGKRTSQIIEKNGEVIVTNEIIGKW